MKPLDHEQAAKNDIIARPEITGNGDDGAKPAAMIAPPPRHTAGAAAITSEPDTLEIAAGRVVARAVDDLKTEIGMAPDKDSNTLLSEVMTGLFSVARLVSNSNPWVRYGVAGAAFAVSVVPPVVKHMAAKNEAKQKENKEYNQ